jgi:hypothetical protein
LEVLEKKIFAPTITGISLLHFRNSEAAPSFGRNRSSDVTPDPPRLGSELHIYASCASPILTPGSQQPWRVWLVASYQFLAGRHPNRYDEHTSLAHDRRYDDSQPLATQQSYIYASLRFSRHFNLSPDRLGMEAIRA